MKTLKHLLILTILLSQMSSYAQQMTPENPMSDIEQELNRLTSDIDLYFEQMISLKSTLAINGLKVTSSKSKMSPDVASALETLEDNKSVIIDSLKNLRAHIDELPKDSESFEKIKFLYDIALVKAFLPRYDVAKVSLFTRVFSSYQPQYVDELIPRNEALNMFFTEFEVNASTKDALNSNYRISEVIKTHNAITSKINELRNSNLYQVYSKNIKPKNGLEEAFLYQSLIRGEEFSEYKPELNSSFVLTKVADDHFTITATCAGLFNP